MSALSFKINAETDKLNSFITSLERLKQVLATIPSGTKEFDVVNKKIAEMEARVEQSIKRITQMQNEAAKTVSQTEPQSLSTPSSTASTAGAQAANAEAEAWRGLLDELHAVSLAKRENIEQIEQLKAANRGLKAQYDALNKAEQNGFALTDKQIARRTSLSLTYEENKQAISRMRQEVANQIKLEQVAHGSIDEMSQALARMRTVYRSLNEGERGNTFGQNLLKNIQALDTKIKELDASMGVHARNVGNYASGWNGLSFSIQQVARELPSLAISPQTFFLAISNNLPILADQLALTRQRVKELKAEGQSFTPVWKQVIKSIISWQTLLVAGITVLTLYGKEITEWVGSLFKGKQAFDAAKQAAEQFHATMTEGAISAQAEITKLDLLYRAATNVAKPYNERKKAVERLQEIYPAYFGNMSEEQVMVGNAISAYNNLRDAIIEAAQARAAMDDITELQGQKITIEYLPEYQQLFGTKQQYNAILMRGRLKGQTDEEYTALLQSYVKAMDEAQKAAEKTLEKNNNELYKKFKESGAKYLTEYVDSLNQQSEYLLHTAEKLLTSSTVEEKNAEAEAARRKAEQDAQKAASQQEKNLNDLGKALQKLRDDALQAEIDSMKDGTEKRVAQIELDYQRRAEAINEAEQRIIELQGKLTQKQEEQFAILRQENDNRRKNERHEAIAGPPIEIDLAALWKKEQADWDEYYMKYGTFREKMQATKDYYDRKMVEATTEGARAAIQAERDAALAVFEVQASDWAKEIVNLSVEKLEELLSEVEAQLETAQTAYDALASSGTQEAAGYIDTINKLKARIAVLNALLGKTKKGVSDSNWAEGARLLNELSATAREAASALSEFDEGLGKAATFIATMASAAGNLIATIDGVTDAASAAGTAMSALEKASLVLTAISAGFQLIQGVFSLFNFGPDYSEYEELKQQYEAINDIWDNLIDKKKEYIDISYGQEVRQTEQEIIDLVNKQTESYKELARARLNSGGSGTTRTIGRRIWRDMSAEGWAQAREALGNDVWKNEWQNEANRMMWLTDLSADQLRTLRDEASIFWTQLDGDVQNYLNSIIEGEEKIEDARKKAQEQRTQISFDSMYDNFISTLMDMDASAKDFSEDFSQYLMKAVLTAKVGTLLSDQLEGWYAAFDEAMKDGVLTEDETEKLREWWDEIVKSGLEMRDTIAQATGVENISSQTATSRGFQVQSQDTGSELNGRFTDIQGKVTDIRGYVMTETQSIIGLISSITSIQIAVIRNVQISNELLQYAVKTYLEVAEINATTKNMDEKLANIETGITRIERNTANI
jgi:predicted CopG family antitoxin